MSSIGKELVDIHGQHEHQGLLKKESHLSFVDAFGGFLEEAAALHSFHNEIVTLRDRVSQIKEKVREREQRIGFLRFQINEIETAALQDDEKKTLEEDKAILLNASRLRESAEAAYDLLY